MLFLQWILKLWHKSSRGNICWRGNHAKRHKTIREEQVFSFRRRNSYEIYRKTAKRTNKFQKHLLLQYYKWNWIQRHGNAVHLKGRPSHFHKTSGPATREEPFVPDERHRHHMEFERLLNQPLVNNQSFEWSDTKQCRCTEYNITTCPRAHKIKNAN